MFYIFRPIAHIFLAAAVGTTAFCCVGTANAHPAQLCGDDWRGDTICVNTAHGEVAATGSWNNTNDMPYIEIVNADTGRIVAGPVVDTQITDVLPHGRYFASYFMISDTSLAQTDSLDSPVVWN